MKVVSTADGGREVLVPDMTSGELVRNMSYLTRVYEPGKDVDHLGEAGFDRRVEAICKHLAARR